MPIPTAQLEPLSGELPDVNSFCAQFGEREIRVKDVRALHGWLSRLPQNPDFAAAALVLESGIRWLSRGSVLGETEPAPVCRLRLLLDVLNQFATCRANLRDAVAAFILNLEVHGLLETGLPNDRGLGAESTDRIARRVLPTPHDERDLGERLFRLFPALSDAEWIVAIPSELMVRLTALLTERNGAADPWAKIRQAVLDTIALIATRTSALGLSREIRERSPELALAASPFFLLPRLCDALFTGIGSAASCSEQIAACREALDVAHAHLEEFGVSVDVVYRIDVINKNLDRLAELLAWAEQSRVEARAEAARTLLSRLIVARVRDRSLRDVVRTNMRLMARKIIERAGDTGEHYITTSRAEYFKMLGSASGGGFLTAGTTVFKYLVMWGHFPLFIEGAFASVNYAASFVLMQLVGFTLATKQPSMTAAALAGSLHGSASEPKLDDLVTTIARICRSQLAAAIGNVGVVIPTCVALHLAFQFLMGHPFLDEHTAEHTLESFHPTHSGTIYFAALTGVFLWLSSLGAGWLENWAVYRRLPEAIAQHRLGRVFGRSVMQWWSKKFAHHISGIGGNVSLGVLLGMMPVIGKFLGLPLEVRHVTLSTGGLTLAVCALGPAAALHHGLWAAAIGIAIIGTLNFGVSFALALGVALRARGIEHAGVRLLKALLGYFVRSPFEFVFPVKSRAERSG